MAKLLLDALQYAALELLAAEGGMGFAALFDRLHARTRADTLAVLKAAQDLYDLSFVDARRSEPGRPAEAGRFVDNLDPEDLRRCYRQLDAHNAGAYLADTRGQADPYYFSASSLGLAERLKPGYAERDRAAFAPGGADELPPPEALKTLPLD